MNGKNMNQTITFTANSTKTYTITFTESSLPEGTSWSVTLNGVTKISTTNTITFNKPNGTYSYTVATSNREYAPIQYSGSFSVNGSNMTINIKFILVTYSIIFTESGLPSGTTWSVTLNGVIHNSTTNMIIFSEPNGSYYYIIMTTINVSTGIRY
ncbi:MAG: DUF7619 domain-containing protein, partial [Thermoplasmata archaeon]